MTRKNHSRVALTMLSTAASSCIAVRVAARVAGGTGSVDVSVTESRRLRTSIDRAVG